MESNNKTNSISLNALCNIMLNFKLKEEPLFVRKDILCPDKFILNYSTALIYTIKNNPESPNEFCFKIDYTKSPIKRPTSSIVQNADMLDAYKSSNVLEKQTLTLDPLYAAEFSEQPLESKIIHISFPKPHTFIENIIAVTTNYGQCEIMTFNLKNRVWDYTILEVNNLWEEIFPSSLYYKKTLKEFQKIRQYIEDYTITTCCWLDNIDELNENLLFCSTISGWIIVIKIKEKPWLLELQFKFKTDLYKINHLQSYSYKINNGNHKTIIICGDIQGRIKVFKFNKNNQQLIEIYTMWNTKDHMSSKNYVINYCSKNDLLFLTTSKSSHFILLIVSGNSDEKIFSKTQLCETQIIGFDCINPYEYFICTTDGCTKHLKIIKNEENIKYTFLLTNIINDFETENYITIGMLATPNKVGWMFLFYPHKLFTQTQYRKKFGFISVYTLNTVDPLNILENIPSEKYLQLENYNDCNEIIRLKIQKNINENYSSYSIEPIEISESFVNRLRIQLILVQGFGGYNLRKFKNRGEDTEFKINDIILTIKAISVYCRLKYIQNIENLSNFQKQSVKCLRRTLSEYLTVNLTDSYSYVRNKLRTYIENLLKSTENMLDNFEENCVYCAQNVDSHTEYCSHDFPRCCISFVQMINMKHCERCQTAVLNDYTLLKEILYENEKINCIYCGICIS